MDDERERLANYTARALLMPIESIYRLLVKSDYEHAGKIKRISVVYQICDRYCVDKINAVKRIKEVALLKGLNI